MSPSFAQDPVVTRTGVNKVVGPVIARSTGQAMNAICREFTTVQVVPEGAPGLWHVFAPQIMRLVVTSRRIRASIETQWVLRKPTVVSPILARPIQVLYARARSRIKTNSTLRKPPV